MEDLLRITVEQIARVAITDILSWRDRKRTPTLPTPPVSRSPTQPVAVVRPYILSRRNTQDRWKF